MRISGAAAFLASGLVVASSFAASPSPDGTLLAYSFIGGPENIYLSTSDGEGARGVVAEEFRTFRPEWFPDGNRILFTAAVDGGPQLFRVDVDGRNLTPLTPLALHASDGHPSPDGRRVVYFRDAEDGFDLHLLDLATGESTRLTDTPEFREYAPRWSPDGERILFVGRVDHETPADIWTLDLRSGERTNVTRTPLGDEFHPAWSRDGRSVTFVRNEDGEFSIHVLDLDRGEDVRVAFEAGVACFSPHFSPDDRWVLFVRNVFEGSKPGLPGVFRVRRDGEELTRLTGLSELRGQGAAGGATE